MHPPHQPKPNVHMNDVKLIRLINDIKLFKVDQKSNQLVAGKISAFCEDHFLFGEHLNIRKK